MRLRAKSEAASSVARSRAASKVTSKDLTTLSICSAIPTPCLCAQIVARLLFLVKGCLSLDISGALVLCLKRQTHANVGYRRYIGATMAIRLSEEGVWS